MLPLIQLRTWGTRDQGLPCALGEVLCMQVHACHVHLLLEFGGKAVPSCRETWECMSS